MTNTFTDLVGCEAPLQLAAMGGPISDCGLVTAVCNAGGLGMLGAAGLPAAVITELLEATSKATSAPVGVGFLMPFVDREAVLAASQRASVVEFFYGDPDREIVEVVHDAGSLAAWQVGSSAEALAAEGAGCDFVIAQGVEAGGHVRGTSALDDLLNEIVGTIEIPIVAAGGIGTADDVADAVERGASAVRIGTRFLAATESPAHPDYIRALIRSTAADTLVTERFAVGWPNAPHRVLRRSLEAAHAAEPGVVARVSMLGLDVDIERFSTMPPTASARGNVAAMAQYAGTSVGAVVDRRPAAQIVAELLGRI